MSRLALPSGVNPPQTFQLADGTQIDLAPLARKLCEHYYGLYPDDLERYGPEGQAWCDHDSRSATGPVGPAVSAIDVSCMRISGAYNKRERRGEDHAEHVREAWEAELIRFGLDTIDL